MNIALCILTLNEIDCLKVIYPLLPPPGETSGYKSIVVIDGGSTDGTVEFFKEKKITVISQKKKGRGEAIKTAIAEVSADAYIFFSPDGNENIKDLNKFEKALRDQNELIIASRMMSEGSNEEDIHWWRPRKWANLFFNFLANLFFNKTGKYITDSINGYRCITRKAAILLDLNASDYTIEYQMTIRAFKKGLKIVEFPTNEGQRIAGTSQVLSFPAGFLFYKRFFSEIL